MNRSTFFWSLDISLCFIGCDHILHDNARLLTVVASKSRKPDEVTF